MGNGQLDGQNQDFKSNERKGRGLFYGIIAVATFIIMAVGATYAYFTATTSSGNSLVRTGSTTLQLRYIGYGAGWMNRDLIPADTEVVEYSFENQNDTTTSNLVNASNALCKDDFGNSICSVYVFQIYNGSNSPQVVSIDVVSEVNGFSSLNAMAYELAVSSANETDYNSTENNNGRYDPTFRKGIPEESAEDTSLINVTDADGITLSEGPEVNQYTPVYVNRKGVTKTLLKYKQSASSVVPALDRLLVRINEENQDAEVKERTTAIASDVEIGGGERKTFALVLYIKNEDRDQTLDDAAKDFSGKVIVGSGDGSTGVSGSISALDINSLQSNQSSSSGTEPGTEPGSGTGTEPGTEPDSGNTEP